MPKDKKIFQKNNFIPYDYIWTKEKPLSYITENFQKILANLEYVNVDKKIKIIQITSSLTREGKSTILSNIGYLLSQKGHKTIIVDLDLRKPKLHRICNVENVNGVAEILSEKIKLEEGILSKKRYGFDAIVAGEKTTAIVNLLESNRIKTLFSKLKEKYDYILIDSPPVISVSDALYISKLSDAMLFVIGHKKAKRAVVKDAVSLLKQNKVNILGVLMSQVDLKSNRYGYSYGYGYGYEYNTKNDDD
jgi:capsular exopolysaccharide synthesis family protein